MAWKRITGPGDYFPSFAVYPAGALSTPAAATLDAVGEYQYAFGNVYWEDAAQHTASSAGGKIHIRLGAATWATAGSTLRVGIKDFDATLTPLRPDATWDTHDDLVQGTDAITANGVNVVTLSAGSKTINHGDLVCVVAEITVRNGADSIGGSFASGSNAAPFGAWFTGGALSFDGRGPGVIIEADDGKFGYIAPIPALSNLASESYQDSTNPDERGLLFQVDEPVKVDEIAATIFPAGTTSDAEYRVYSDPLAVLGAPALMLSATLIAERMGNGMAYVPHALAAGAELEFWPGRDYGVMVKGTGAGNVSLTVMTLASAAHRSCFRGGTTLRKGHRQWATGSDPGTAFTETTTIVPQFRMRRSHIWASPSPRYFLGV